jgi:Response regulator of the LytR/AlgR family
MGKAALWLRAQGAEQQAPAAVETVYLTVQHHGALKRVPLADILYCRAEAKYTTLRTAEQQYLVDLSLTDLEQRYAEHLVRIHRSALVAAPAIRSLERPISPPDGIAPEPETGSTEADSGAWTLHLHGVPDTLPVSRRRVAAVQALLTASRPAAARQPPK